MRKLILAFLVLTGARFDCAGRAPEPQPPFALPYIQWDVCAAPCCVYGTWKPQSDIFAHRAPSMASPYSFRIPAGQAFHAVTGEIITWTPGIAVVRRAGGAFAKGDTLWVLAEAKKGGFTVWGKGKLHRVDLATEPASAPETPAEGEGLRAVRSTPQVAEWWVRARSVHGYEGWIRVDPRDPRMDGMGKCP